MIELYTGGPSAVKASKLVRLRRDVGLEKFHNRPWRKRQLSQNTSPLTPSLVFSIQAYEDASHNPHG